MKANFYNIKKLIPKDFQHTKPVGAGIPLDDKTYFLEEDSFRENGTWVTFCYFSTGNGKCEVDLVNILSDNFKLTFLSRRFHYVDFLIEAKN